MFNSIAFLNTLLWTLAPSMLYAIVLLFVDPKRPKLLHMYVCNYSKKEMLAEKPVLPGNGSLRFIRKV